MTSTAAPTPRGTRPRDRRAQIRAAATTLFYERGYEQVSVADVAEAVNIGPSALYRHFSGKADLLFESIVETINAFGEMVEELPSRDLPGIALTSARTALAYRPLGVLWQREARNLPPEQQDLLRGRLREAVATLATTVNQIRPELTGEQAVFLATADVTSMSSISFHHLQLPEDLFERTLAELAGRVLSFEFPATPPADLPAAVVPVALHRRDEIAIVAATLFAEHGFDAVSLDDIGAAVGVAGPTLYNHFASKQELLLASMSHGYRKLDHALGSALASARTPEESLNAITDTYVALAHEESDLLAVLIAEARNLPPEYSTRSHQARVDYLGTWVGLLQELRPEEDPVVSRLKVHAVLMMANSTCRTPYLRDRPGFRRDLTEICRLLVS